MSRRIFGPDGKPIDLEQLRNRKNPLRRSIADEGFHQKLLSKKVEEDTKKEVSQKVIGTVEKFDPNPQRKLSTDVAQNFGTEKSKESAYRKITHQLRDEKKNVRNKMNRDLKDREDQIKKELIERNKLKAAHAQTIGNKSNKSGKQSSFDDLAKKEAPKRIAKLSVGNKNDVKEKFTSPGKILQQNERFMFNNQFFSPGVLKVDNTREFKRKYRQHFEENRAREERLAKINVVQNDMLATNNLASNLDVPDFKNRGNTIEDAYNKRFENDRFNKPRISLLNVDSRNRNFAVYPNPNQYRIEFPESFENVKQVKLVGLIFPNTEQVIRDDPPEVVQARERLVFKCGEVQNTANNRLYWNNAEDCDQDFECLIYEAAITPGNYTASELQTEIEERIAEINKFSDTLPHEFLVTIDRRSDIVRIQSIDSEQLQLNPLTSFAGSNILQITQSNHGFVVGDQATISGAEGFASIPASVLNRTHTVTTVIDENNFEVFISVIASFSGEGGGSNVFSGVQKPIKLRFSNLDTVGQVLGFPQQDSSEQVNKTIEFIDIRPPDLSQLPLTESERGELPARICSTDHCLQVGDEIVVTNINTIPPIKGKQIVTKVIDKDKFEIGVPIKVVNNQTIFPNTRLGFAIQSLDETTTQVTMVTEAVDGFITTSVAHNLSNGVLVYFDNVNGALLEGSLDLDQIQTVSNIRSATEFEITPNIIFANPPVVTNSPNALVVETTTSVPINVNCIIPKNNGVICPSGAIPASTPSQVFFKNTDVDPPINGEPFITPGNEPPATTTSTFAIAGPIGIGSPELWQSFIIDDAAIDDPIFLVQVKTFLSNPDTSTGTLNIYDGAPALSTFTPVAPVALPLLGSFPIENLDVSSDTGQNIHLQSDAIELIPGNTYTFEFVPDSALPRNWTVNYNTGTYTNGISSLDNYVVGTDHDLIFQLFVSYGIQPIDFYSTTTGKFDLVKQICSVNSNPANQNYIVSNEPVFRKITEIIPANDGLIESNIFHPASGISTNTNFSNFFFINADDPAQVTPSLNGLQLGINSFGETLFESPVQITAAAGPTGPGLIRFTATNDVVATTIQNVYPQNNGLICVPGGHGLTGGETVYIRNSEIRQNFNGIRQVSNVYDTQVFDITDPVSYSAFPLNLVYAGVTRGGVAFGQKSAGYQYVVYPDVDNTGIIPFVNKQNNLGTIVDGSITTPADLVELTITGNASFSANLLGVKIMNEFSIPSIFGFPDPLIHAAQPFYDESGIIDLTKGRSIFTTFINETFDSLVGIDPNFQISEGTLQITASNNSPSITLADTAGDLFVLDTSGINRGVNGQPQSAFKIEAGTSPDRLKFTLENSVAHQLSVGDFVYISPENEFVLPIPFEALQVLDFELPGFPTASERVELITESDVRFWDIWNLGDDATDATWFIPPPSPNRVVRGKHLVLYDSANSNYHVFEPSTNMREFGNPAGNSIHRKPSHFQGNSRHEIIFKNYESNVRASIFTGDDGSLGGNPDLISFRPQFPGGQDLGNSLVDWYIVDFPGIDYNPATSNLASLGIFNQVFQVFDVISPSEFEIGGVPNNTGVIVGNIGPYILGYHKLQTGTVQSITKVFEQNSGVVQSDGHGLSTGANVYIGQTVTTPDIQGHNPFVTVLDPNFYSTGDTITVGEIPSVDGKWVNPEFWDNGAGTNIVEAEVISIIPANDGVILGNVDGVVDGTEIFITGTTATSTGGPLNCEFFTTEISFLSGSLVGNAFGLTGVSLLSQISSNAFSSTEQLGKFIVVPEQTNFQIQQILPKTNGVLYGDMTTGLPLVGNGFVYAANHNLGNLTNIVFDSRRYPFDQPTLAAELLNVEISRQDIDGGTNKVDKISETDINSFPNVVNMEFVLSSQSSIIPVIDIERDSNGTLKPAGNLTVGQTIYITTNVPGTSANISGFQTVSYVDLGTGNFFELDGVIIDENGLADPLGNLTGNEEIFYFSTATTDLLQINGITEGGNATVLTITNHGIEPIGSKINLFVFGTDTIPGINFLNNCVTVLDEDTLQLDPANVIVQQVINRDNILNIDPGTFSVRSLCSNSGIPVFSVDEGNLPGQTIITTEKRVPLPDKISFDIITVEPMFGGSVCVTANVPPDYPTFPDLPFNDRDKVFIGGVVGGNPYIDGEYTIFQVSGNQFKLMFTGSQIIFGPFQTGTGGVVTGPAPPDIGHGLQTGDEIVFRDVSTVPDINALTDLQNVPLPESVFTITRLNETQFTIPIQLESFRNDCPGLWCSNTLEMIFPNHGLVDGDIFFLYNSDCVGGILPQYINTVHGDKRMNIVTNEEKLTRRTVRRIDDKRLQFKVDNFACVRTKGGGFDLCISSSNHNCSELAMGLRNHGFAATQTNVLCNGLLNRVINLEGDQYVFMLSPQLESVQNTGEVREIFAKIQLVDLPGNLLYNTFVSNDRVFDNPKAVLDYLDIEFRKFDGKLFQFNGIEHSFSLEIYTYLDRLRNTYVSSRRGIEDRGVVSQQGFIESTISAENPGQNIISPLAQLEQSSITRQATDPTN